MRGDGRLFQRGRIWWFAYYHDGREQRESAGTTNEAVARRKLRDRLRTAGTTEFVGPREEKLRFDDLANLYLTDYRINRRRSLSDAERLVTHLRSFFANDRALVIPPRIGAYIEWRLSDRNNRGQPIANATVNRELSALRRMFRLAVIHGRLKAKPHVPLLEENNAREGFFEPSEFEQVVAHLPDAIADVARFAFLTGWRKGEILTLEWRDVSLAAGTIRLRHANSKTKEGRVLRLSSELLELVRRRAEQRRLDCPFVFHRDGRPIRTFRKAWADACRAAGMEGRLFHDLRRSGVRNMIRARVPQNVAMRISGHKTDSVFRRYDIVNEDDIADAITATERYVARRRKDPSRVTPIHANGRED